jgi:hypothetical protein
VTWYRTEEPEHINQQTLLKTTTSLQLHIFLDAANAADADALARIAATLKKK